jgi:hypothetical protein
LKAKPKKQAPRATTTAVTVGNEIRGDQILLTAQKIGRVRLITRTGQHKAHEVVGEKNAHAILLKAYSSTQKP